MTVYTATAQRVGGWWMVQCDQQPGALSQVRRLDKAPEENREAIAFVTGEPAEQIEVSVVPRLEPAVEDELAAVRQLTDTAERAATQAADQRVAVARRLHGKGLTVRDIGQIMGVSYQRAAQLIHTAERSDRADAS
jgi:DNA-directed RNA polymerase specialized sigma24 family protein